MTKARALIAAAALVSAVSLSAPVLAQEHDTPNPPRQKWSFSGITGKFDTAQLQRGFKVYREVCQACHWLKIPFRTLAQNGGPQFSVAQVTQLASEYKVQDGPNDAGEMFERPARPADIMPWTFANENAAATAMGGKAPPQMQLLAKSRSFERGFPWFVFDALPFFAYQEHGPDYIHGILDGYKDEPPKGFQLPDGGHYNEYFPGHVIAMPKPLQDDQVDYPKMPDGKPQAPQTVDQYARDVAAFLAWAADPTLVQRKRVGIQVLLFLIVFAGLIAYTKKKVWAKVGGEAEGLPGTAPLGPTG